MIQSIAEAIKNQDYLMAKQLLKPLLQKEPNNPWLRFYVGRVYEGTGKLEAAETVYRQLLPHTSNPKLIAQIRQGLARLEAIAAVQEQNALAEATAAPGGDQWGVLILEPLSSDRKQEAARDFSKIMKVDPYSARLQLPGRGWRLYRVGKLGELAFYTHALNEANIPSFCFALNQLEQLQVFMVQYFQTVKPEVIVRCKNQGGQEGMLTFDWSEVTQMVEGRIPILESVVTVDAKHQLKRKIQTQDYIPFYDLHLPGRNVILRLCDRHYHFQQGVTINQAADQRETVSQKWSYLLNFLEPFLGDLTLWSDFTTFADTALDFGETLKKIESYMGLDRRIPSLWDEAFQLYSALVFWRSNLTLPRLPG